MDRVIVSGLFDDLRYSDFRFLAAAAEMGAVTALVEPDDTATLRGEKPVKFPQVERDYLLTSMRWIDRVILLQTPTPTNLLPPNFETRRGDVWCVREADATSEAKASAIARHVELRVIAESELAAAAPEETPDAKSVGNGKKKVVVTGCFDWFHSGHVRFFEECAELGDLYVVVGHDENIRLLKGEGHPLFPATQRRFIAGSIRFVKQALISTGDGWMDAEPEFAQIKPDIYAVNEDGDRPEKRAFCDRAGIEYRVLKRLPKAGLPKRQSTMLRGF